MRQTVARARLSRDGEHAGARGRGPAPPDALRERILDVARRASFPERRRPPPATGARADGDRRGGCRSLAIGLGVWALAVELARRRAQRARRAGARRGHPRRRQLHACPDGRAGRARPQPDGDAVMVVRNLAPAPEGQTYEAWVIDSGGPVPAGLFEGGGQEIVLLEEPVAEGTMVAVTLEPDGGSSSRRGTSSSEAGQPDGRQARPADRDPGREGTDRVPSSRSPTRRSWPSSPPPTASSRWPSSTTATGRSRTASPTACCGTPRSPRTRSRRRSSPSGGRRHVHPRARQAPHVAAHARAPARRRPRAREQRRRMPAAAEEPAPATPAAEDEAALRDRRRAVQAALTQLPADQREALELAYYGGLTRRARRSNSAFRSAPSRAGCSPAYAGSRPAPGSRPRSRA